MIKRIFKSLPLLLFMFAFNSGSGNATVSPKEELNEKVIRANVIDIEARINYQKALKRNIELKKNSNVE